MSSQGEDQPTQSRVATRNFPLFLERDDKLYAGTTAGCTPHLSNPEVEYLPGLKCLEKMLYTAPGVVEIIFACFRYAVLRLVTCILSIFQYQNSLLNFTLDCDRNARMSYQTIDSGYIVKQVKQVKQVLKRAME